VPRMRRPLSSLVQIIDQTLSAERQPISLSFSFMLKRECNSIQ
jgi:hypothetical protein